jgi:hypothetical protein
MVEEGGDFMDGRRGIEGHETIVAGYCCCQQLQGEEGMRLVTFQGELGFRKITLSVPVVLLTL